ncbi:MAG: hypothetical protein KZQ58_12930, partial [gamma proteobacterium symbiont of Bathyaustriella thionipta]|nr:hypothetical protein [gamma proteobacterium symbiont of Bathyaustriella thionipta]
MLMIVAAIVLAVVVLLAGVLLRNVPAWSLAPGVKVRLATYLVFERKRLNPKKNNNLYTVQWTKDYNAC